MYFIIKGEIELIRCFNNNSKQKIVYQNLKKGDSFGSFSFLTGDFREMGAKSLSVSHLAYLTQSDFLEKLKDFPDDFVIIHFCMVYIFFSN
jgi:CRP-like cAMP-binding protein